MQYILNETQIYQITDWLKTCDQYYSDEDFHLIKVILEKAIAQKQLNENDVYELLRLLPKTIPQIHEDDEVNDQQDNCTEWNGYNDTDRKKHEREMENFCQVLLNWIFMQNSIRNNSSKSENILISAAAIKAIGHGMK